MLVAVVQLHPLSSLAASYRSEPNPIGEKAYAAHSLTLLFPVAIIVCAFLLVLLVSRIRGKASKPTDWAFTEFKRPHQKLIDPQKCMLAQGIVCMGPATRGGCEAVCPQGNMPCTGCFGPTSRVRDQGAKILSSLCANLAAKEEPQIQSVLAGIPDPVGTFYRYGLAKSILRRKVNLPSNG